MLYSLLHVVFWVITHLICRYRVSGCAHVPRTGPLLIVANHLSWYDPILLAVILPRRAWFFTKAEVFRWPIIGRACRLTGQIPVSRGESDRAALEQALAYLREGKALVVFPEGTVERQEQMIAAHTGAAMLAVRSGAAVLPIAHTGTRRVLRSWRACYPRVDVCIGEPYAPEVPKDVPRKVALHAVSREMMARVAEMLPPAYRGIYASSKRE